MNLVTTISTGIAAFAATNIDDLVLLTLFFAQVNATFRPRHIFLGQYLGFSVLVLASLPGFFGALVVPPHWIGLLGLIPIAMGFSRLLNREDDGSTDAQAANVSSQSPITSLLSAQTYSVAAVTIANGSDNIGIYAPLFANIDLQSLLIILGEFFLLVGVWCYAAAKLSSLTFAPLLTRYSNTLAPFILIGLGSFIVLESSALTPLALVISCLCLMGLVKNYRHQSEEQA